MTKPRLYIIESSPHILTSRWVDRLRKEFRGFPFFCIRGLNQLKSVSEYKKDCILVNPLVSTIDTRQVYTIIKGDYKEKVHLSVDETISLYNDIMGEMILNKRVKAATLEPTNKYMETKRTVSSSTESFRNLLYDLYMIEAYKGGNLLECPILGENGVYLKHSRIEWHYDETPNISNLKRWLYV